MNMRAILAGVYVARKTAEVSVVYKRPVKDSIMPDHLYDNTLSKAEAQQLFDAMGSGTRHNALGRTRFDLNGLTMSSTDDRIQGNPRLTRFRRWMLADGEVPDEDKYSYTTNQAGDLFLPHHDVVSVPSGMPGVAMHELGHAIDFNDFPSDSAFRRGVADMYTSYAPTLWKERAAWRKGEDAVSRAAATGRIDPALAVKTLANAAPVKHIGMGSYVGSMLGGVLGGASGLGLLAYAIHKAKQNNIRLGGAGLGQMAAAVGVAGAAAGAVGGTWWGQHKARVPVDEGKVLRGLAVRMAKIKGTASEEEEAALRKLLSSRAKSKKPAGKRFEVDRWDLHSEDKLEK